MLNFYTSPASAYASKVHYFLEESGQPYKLHPVNLGKPESRQVLEQWNVFGKVPAIELNGFGLGESHAILRYLASKWQMDAWYPQQFEDRARVDQLMEFTSQHVSRHLMTIAWHDKLAARFGMLARRELIEPAREDLLKALPRLERYLAGRSYLAAATPTIADASFLPFVALHAFGGLSLSDWPNLGAWFQRMSQRPAWIKSESERAKLLAAR